MQNTKFYKLRRGRAVSGVLAGLADKYGWDVSVVRIVFLAICFFTNFPMIIFYIVLANILPYKEDIERKKYGTDERRRKEADVVDDDTNDGWFW